MLPGSGGACDVRPRTTLGDVVPTGTGLGGATSSTDTVLRLDRPDGHAGGSADSDPPVIPIGARVVGAWVVTATLFGVRYGFLVASRVFGLPGPAAFFAVRRRRQRQYRSSAARQQAAGTEEYRQESIGRGHEPAGRSTSRLPSVPGRRFPRRGWRSTRPVPSGRGTATASGSS